MVRSVSRLVRRDTKAKREREGEIGLRIGFRRAVVSHVILTLRLCWRQKATWLTQEPRG